MGINAANTAQMKAYPELSNLVMTELTRTVGLIGFDDKWRFNVSFKKIKGDTLANCLTEWQYKKATITFDLKKMAKHDALFNRASVRHELFHVILCKIFDLIEAFSPDQEELVRKFEEELCTFFEYMPLWERIK